MKTPILAGIFAALLVFAGCQSVNTVERAEPLANPSPLLSKVEITDSFLGNRMKVVNVAQTIVSGDLLKVQAEIQSTSNHYRTFNYRFIWIEESGMAVQSPAPTWRSAQLPAGGVVYISDVAPNPRAVDFKLELISSGDAR
ncbi:MAG: DUF1425 domain-containing protein [Puniceicoccales bacterium]